MWFQRSEQVWEQTHQGLQEVKRCVMAIANPRWGEIHITFGNPVAVANSIPGMWDHIAYSDISMMHFPVTATCTPGFTSPP